MKKIVFILSIIASLFIAVYTFAVVFNDITEFEEVLFVLMTVFFLAFGLYGLYAEQLYTKFRAKGKNDNLCVEANYYVRQKGFLGRVFLFPFIKIKSSNSFFVSFLGAVAWVIILSILIKAIFG